MKVNQNYVLLCGYFSYDADGNEALGHKLETHFEPWFARKQEGSQDYFRYLESYYYSSFMAVAFPEAPSVLIGKRGGANKMRHLAVKHLAKGVPVALSDLRYRSLFEVDYADVYLFPQGIGVFAIKTRVVPELGHDLEFGDISNYLYLVRSEQARIDTEEGPCSLTDWIHERVLFSGPGARSWSLFGTAGDTGGSVVSYNNKPKAFIVLESDFDVATDEGKQRENRLLFEIGTGARVGTIEENGHFAPSREYFEQIVGKNTISVFNNWSALSLFDTFTVILNKTQDSKFSTFHNFEQMYLPIYIHAIFVKFILYKMNSALSRLPLESRKNRGIRDRFLSIKHGFYLSHVSYNFLPNEIYQKLLASLDIETEISVMEERIERINDYIEERSSATMNMFLAFMAFISPFSALWDLLEWTDKVFQFGSSYTFFSALVVVAFFLVPLSVIFANNMRKRKRG